MNNALPLKRARVRKGLTQEQLAFVAGITNVTISNIENGQVKPNPTTREKIEKVIGSVDWERTFDEGQVKRRILTN
ncbi:hypothetical protein Asal01_01718 [Fodinibius salicampi]